MSHWQYEPEPDSDEDTDLEEDGEEEDQEEDEYEVGSSTGKRKSLGEGDRTPKKRRKTDVSYSCAIYAHFTKAQ